MPCPLPPPSTRTLWPSRLPTPAATKSAKKVPATGDATSGTFALLAVAGLVVAGAAAKVRK